MKKTTIKYLLIALFALGFLSQTYSQVPAPVNLSVSAAKAEMMKGVNLKWEYPAKVLVNFIVYRKDGAASDTGTFKRIGKASIIPYFFDMNVLNGKKYTYYVTAMGPDQESQPSNLAEITYSFTEPAKGTLTGTVISDGTNNPVKRGKVQFIPVNPLKTPYLMSVPTDTMGRFSANLLPGSYYVYAIAEKFAGEFYENAKSRDLAKTVSVAENGTADITISLAPFTPPVLYTIKGSVKNNDGKAVRSRIKVFRLNAFVNNEKYSEQGKMKESCNISNGFTDDQGNYTVTVRNNDTVVVFAEPIRDKRLVSQDYLPQYYINKKTLQEADRLVVTSDLRDINFVLESKPVLANSISGKVTDTLSQGVAAGVVAYRIIDGKYGFAKTGVLTDSTGNYTLANLTPGKYLLQAIPRPGYIPSYYRADGISVFSRKNADTLIITEATVMENINFTVKGINTLGGKGSIAGFIKDSYGKGIRGALSVILNEKGQYSGFAMTDENGQYTVEGLASGTYMVSADMYEYKDTAPGYASITSENVTPVVIFTMETASVSAAPENKAAVPAAYSLKQNYPNPFNPSTTISYSIPNNGFVTLKVYNILGNEVATLINEEKPAGSYSAVFNAGNIPSGIYFYTLTSGKYSETKKLVLLK